MQYRIELSSSAKKEILALPGNIRAQARQLLHKLSENPVPPRAKELREKPNIYRIWLAGKWRVAYEINEELQSVRILRIRSKDKIDYESLTSTES